MATCEPYLFISYRVEDAHDAAQAIYVHSAEAFGDENVFMDVRDLSGGAQWADAIAAALERCSCMLVVIGTRWFAATDAETGENRLEQSNDWVRREIARALERDVGVIPVLLHGARLPKASELPEPIRKLAGREAIGLRRDSWQANLNEIVDTLARDFRFPVRRSRWRMGYWARVVVLTVVGIVMLVAFLALSGEKLSGLTMLGIGVTALVVATIAAWIWQSKVWRCAWGGRERDPTGARRLDR